MSMKEKSFTLCIEVMARGRNPEAIIEKAREEMSHIMTGQTVQIDDTVGEELGTAEFCEIWLEEE